MKQSSRAHHSRASPHVSPSEPARVARASPHASIDAMPCSGGFAVHLRDICPLLSLSMLSNLVFSISVPDVIWSTFSRVADSVIRGKMRLSSAMNCFICWRLWRHEESSLPS